jgi:hypothetical protein
MEILSDFLTTVNRLFWGYITHGWLFAIGHALVLEQIIYRSWHQKIRLETRALEEWARTGIGPEREGAGREQHKNVPETQSSDGQQTGGGSETTQLLDQFVSESKKLGRQGFFVPMTDFSDRLDSIVDGMIGELHDRTNLFLLIGIAGTLFGLFEFAFKAVDVLQSGAIEPGERVLKLGEFLAASMSKAFPVGFMGLVLTFLAQIFVAYPERRLRTALTDATQKALHSREDASTSQVEAIRDAMSPLNDLKETLTQSVQPVVVEFGERLDQSLSLVKIQFDELRTTTGSLATAVDSVKTGVDSLNSAADNLKALLQDVPVILKDVTELQAYQRSSIENLSESFREQLTQTRELTFAVGQTVQNLNTLPGEIIRENKLALYQLSEDTLEIYRAASQAFGEQLHHDYDVLFDDIGTRVDDIKNSMTGVSAELTLVAKDAGGALEGLRSLPADIRGELKEAFGNLSEESLKAWKALAGEFNTGLQGEYSSYISNIQEQAGKIQTNLGRAAEEWQRVAQNAEGIIKEPIRQLIVDGKKEIGEGLQRLDRVLAERYPQASQDVKNFTDDLREMTARTKEFQKAFGEWLGEARRAQDNIREVYRALLEALDEIKKKGGAAEPGEMVTQLKAVRHLLERIQKGFPESSDGLHGELLTSNRLLSEINNGVEAMAHKEGIFGRFFGRRSS